MALDDVS
jgi:hypothetical protein